MRYFLDTEFIENPGTIQLISIGIVDENGRTFYAENTSFDERMASEWVRDNVMDKLKWWSPAGGLVAAFSAIDDRRAIVFGTVSLIRKALIEFFAADPEPIFYGYFSDYDWVIFCWIFGKMIDLPKGFPMYCRDLKQMLDESGKGNIPKPEGKHNALVDALWNRDLYNFLKGS